MRKKHFFCTLLLLALCMIAPAMAEDQTAAAEGGVVHTGSVHPDLPELTLTVTDTGEKTDAPIGRNILQVKLEMRDGSLSQSL